MIRQQRKRFFEWFLKTKKLRAGMHNIKVAECLIVGEFWRAEPEVAIVRDSQNRILALPEVGGLISRWDVREGMKLRIKVDEKGISEVSVLSVLN